MSIIKPVQQVGSTHQPHPITSTLTRMQGAFLVVWDPHLSTPTTNMGLDCISKRCSVDNSSSTLTCTNIPISNSSNSSSSSSSSICSSRTKCWLGRQEVKSTELIHPSTMIPTYQAVAMYARPHTTRVSGQQLCPTRLNWGLSMKKGWTQGLQLQTNQTMVKEHAVCLIAATPSSTWRGCQPQISMEVEVCPSTTQVWHLSNPCRNKWKEIFFLIWHGYRLIKPVLMNHYHEMDAHTQQKILSFC